MRQLCWILLLLGLWRPAQGQLVADMIDTVVPVTAPVTEQVGQALHVGLESAAALETFTGVALQGMATGDSLAGWIRFEDAGVWGPWFPLYIVRSFTDAAFLAAWRGGAPRTASRFALRFDTNPGSAVTVLLAGTFVEEEVLPPPDERLGQAQDLSAFVIWPPHLHDRSEWNAEPFRGTPSPLNRPDYLRMTLHHTAGFAAVTLSEGLEQVKRIQDFHQNGRGWSDIGYHYLMDQEGRLYQGRPYLNPAIPFEDGPPLALGAHVGGANTGNIGVSLMGCYHPPEGNSCRHVMTVPAQDSLVVTLSYLSERYSVAPDALAGHRDFSSTACPGDNNYGLLPTFRSQVADLLLRGNAPLGRAALSALADTFGVVALQWRFLADAGIESFYIERENADGTAIVLERSGAEDGHWVDGTIQSPGGVSYVLSARGSRGRDQILGTASTRVAGRSNYVLVQSFPNPTSREATVRYYLEQEGVVTLQIFDTSGRLVRILTDDYRERGMWHAVTFDAADLAPGTYFCRLHVEGFAGTVYKAAHALVVIR